jgi:hypothetical protein
VIAAIAYPARSALLLPNAKRLHVPAASHAVHLPNPDVLNAGPGPTRVDQRLAGTCDWQPERQTGPASKLLREHSFDAFAETECAKFFANVFASTG